MTQAKGTHIKVIETISVELSLTWPEGNEQLALFDFPQRPGSGLVV